MIQQTSDPETQADQLEVVLHFPETVDLPLTVQHLFNTLNDCEPNVQLGLVPRRDRPGIVIVGAKTALPVPSIDARGLRDALLRLAVTRDDVLGRLLGADDEAEDWWARFGGEG